LSVAPLPPGRRGEGDRGVLKQRRLMLLGDASRVGAPGRR
jgi:hypothetical protein